MQVASNHGGVAEWSIAAVLKTAEPQGSVGSNPTPSAFKASVPQRSGGRGFEIGGSGSNASTRSPAPAGRRDLVSAANEIIPPPPLSKPLSPSEAGAEALKLGDRVRTPVDSQRANVGQTFLSASSAPKPPISTAGRDNSDRLLASFFRVPVCLAYDFRMQLDQDIAFTGKPESGLSDDLTD